MNTTINKAVVAILGGAATIAANWGLNLDPDLVNWLGVVITGVLVWAGPNKRA